MPTAPPGGGHTDEAEAAIHTVVSVLAPDLRLHFLNFALIYIEQLRQPEMRR
jgi:hypothetical protein